MNCKAVLVDYKGFFKTVEMYLEHSKLHLEYEWPKYYKLESYTPVNLEEVPSMDTVVQHTITTFRAAEPVPGYEKYARYYREKV